MSEHLGCEVVTLPDGARAMKDLASGQIMHCGAGPAIEPHDIYLKPSRFDQRLSEVGDTLVLFDVGLGAGSNALAAWKISEAKPHSSRRLEIVSFENDVRPFQLALEQENHETFGYNHSGALLAARELLLNGFHQTARTTWRLIVGDFAQTIQNQPSSIADIIFWDIYSARSCPNLWTVAVFKQLRRCCRDGATFHTTSASTAARAALLLAGFAVGRSAGAGNRDETTMAATDYSHLENPLDARWVERLKRSSAIFSPDVTPSDIFRIHELPQFQSSTANR